MRILMITHAYPPTFGGTESHVWDICHQLSSRGHQVLVLAGGEDVPTLGSVPVHRHLALSARSILRARENLPGNAPPDTRLLAEIRSCLAGEFADFKPDIVHVHNAHHFGPELARACLDLAEVPVVNGVHDRVGEYLYPEVLDWPWALVVFVSGHLRDALPTGRPAVTRWLGIDMDSFRPNGPRDERLEQLERPVIFHPARLLRWKGVECGVRAFARLHNDFGGTLVLCASEDIVDDPQDVAAFRRELVTIAEDLGVAQAVRFTSFDRQRIADAYRAADLIWYPTIDAEPLGLVPLEAMACGIPLVVSRSGGMQETVVDGETGLMVPPGDPDALESAARRVLSDPSLRAALVRQGLLRAARFDNTAYVDWLERTYLMTVEAGTERER
ncbi:glycosyltransferase family 4 protein [Micromonospora andamanensis]|uniref:Glycosyl transferase n=1 Tax=Micromonospora andamanensis TaxID=1287068 RepID=A0ABQ4I2G9_9ACTN|nr:glycosyltransferase family 4 protein [Micromonospora andamanensis]GIJ12060.1 glycosyl transferase [Micromonospora andamanensis]